jgi:hypothetical protein
MNKAMNKTMNPEAPMNNGLARLILSVCLALPVIGFAADALPTLTPQSQNGVTYISGGIADGGQEKMLGMRKDYNLHLTFAMKKTGEYQADVAVHIQDAKGNKVLETVSPGPLFYAKLPAGKYKISATSNDKMLSKWARIGKKGSKVLYFYWENKDTTGQ